MKLRICVIGAGAAGLCAGRHMIYSPDKFEFTIFEQSSQLGGTWNYTERTGTDEYNIPIHSSMTNIPKEIMGYPDFPFTNTGKSFTHHSQVLLYLKEYADTHKLSDRIKFRSHVKTITPEELSPNKRVWKVAVTDLQTGIDTNYEFDGVMVCNGHFSVPHIPQIENIEEFKGKKIHSHSYREPEIYNGQTIVILGAASSGMDIAIEASHHAKQIYLSHNNEKHTCKLPDNITQTPGIKMATEDGFYFLDDSFVKADAIIFCTGYQYNFPFLTEKCRVNIRGNRVMPLYKHLVHMDFPELCFIGLPFTVLPFPLFHYQVQYYLKIWGQIIKLPDRETMERETDLDYKKRVVDMKMPPKHAHKMGPLQWGYFQELGNLTDSEELPPVFQMIYDAVEGERMNNVMFYKKENYRLLSGEEYVKVKPEP
ncbi:hypothetical protein RUM43_011044 [Polyplax serrata]|uniref:Flavin-containing monooxygenase n=1 Tax=Polyplax serrata TaxID=468196 RepID=A0AAN8S3H1_POLSC